MPVMIPILKYDPTISPVCEHLSNLHVIFVVSSESEGEEAKEVADLPDNLDLIKPTSNAEYINKIRKRLNEDSRAREEREKRRRKVLQDQLRSHEAQEVYF